MTAFGLEFAWSAPWLSEVPAHWVRTTLRRSARWVRRKNVEHDDSLLSLSAARGLVPKRWDDASQERTGAELEKYWRIEPGDLVVNPMWVMNGGIGVSGRPGVVSPDYRVYRLGPQLVPRFVHHLMKSQPYLSLYPLLSRGQTTFDRRVGREDFELLPVLVPPISTQRAIADFLDRKTAAIDALIEKKERLIALLQEKRQALITQAVTKGLDPSVPMKDSGIEWLGEIPAHWGLIQVRRIVRELCDGPFGSSLKSDHYEDDGVRVIRLQNIRRGWFDGRDEAFISTEHFSGLRRHEALPGDLLIAGLGDTNHPVGRACILPSHVERAMVKADCYRARLEQDAILHAYAAEFFSSDVGAMGFAYSSRGTTRTRINLSVVRDMWIPVPPMQEQAQISTHLASVRERYSALEARAFSSVQTLREYRQALITAAVTGQIDVTKEAA